MLVGSYVDAELATRHIEATEREVEVVGHVTDPAELAAVLDEGHGTDVLLLDSFSLDAAFPEPMTTLEADGVGFLQRGRCPRHAARTAGRARDRRDAVRPAARPQLPVVQGAPQATVRPHLARRSPRRSALPVLALLALYVRIRAGSPVLYHQARIGKDGEQFMVVKFRTMVVDAETRGPRLATADDDRIVQGLRWLR